MQICNDYGVMLANYSPGLLGIKNKERTFDDDPFEIVGNLFNPAKEPQVLDDLRQQGDDRQRLTPESVILIHPFVPG